MANPDQQQNPYASPSLSSEISYDARPGDLAKTLKDFRRQIHALGGFWILIGGFALAVGLFGLNVSNDADEDERQALFALMIVAGGVGLLWITLGILACLKMIPAVYIGLVLSYISLISSLLRLNLCGLVIVGAIIIQSHRVIGFAKQLKAAGIPLNTKPTNLLID